VKVKRIGQGINGKKPIVGIRIVKRSNCGRKKIENRK
jgi:hypothetical protein